MNLGEEIDKALDFVTVASFRAFGLTFNINETLIISWIVMLILIAGSLLLTRRLKTVPRGPQALLEAAVEFLNNFSRQQFGRRAKVYGPYIGTVFLFLLLANIIPVLSPIGASFGGRHYEPLFTIKPPARDINLTAALAIVSILMVLFGGLRARGIKGWAKHLLAPIPMMLPFNLI